jgi:hypothetical protein
MMTGWTASVLVVLVARWNEAIRVLLVICGVAHGPVYLFRGGRNKTLVVAISGDPSCCLASCFSPGD